MRKVHITLPSFINDKSTYNFATQHWLRYRIAQGEMQPMTGSIIGAVSQLPMRRAQEISLMATSSPTSIS